MLARTARMQSTKCCAPPSRRSSRSTLVITTYLSVSAAIVSREVARLLGIQRERPAVRHVAERAAARAQVAHDHEGGGAVAEALADVRAGRFLAHGVQLLLAQDLLDLGEALAAAGAHADPLGLAQRLALGTILIGMRAVFRLRASAGASGRQSRDQGALGRALLSDCRNLITLTPRSARRVRRRGPDSRRDRCARRVRGPCPR